MNSDTYKREEEEDEDCYTIDNAKIVVKSSSENFSKNLQIFFITVSRNIFSICGNTDLVPYALN